MDLAAAESFLLSLRPGKIDLDLERLRGVLADLGLLPPPFPLVIIGGTNGKGSAAVFAEALLSEHLKAGAFVKPHVYSITERVRIGGQPSSAEAFAGATEGLANYLGSHSREVTFFEATLIVALLALRDAGVQIALVEVGLGGRFDAANALPRILVGLTSIGRDHERYLGSSLAGIAVEKAGVMAEGVPVILSRGIRRQSPDCHEILCKLAALKHAPVVEPGVKLKRLCGSLDPPQQDFETSGGADGLDLPPRLRINQLGLYQQHNLEVALAIASELLKLGHLPERFRVPANLSVFYPARFEVHRVGRGCVVLDAAHNEEGMRALAEALREYLPGVQPTLVFGCQQGKDVARMLSPLKGLVARIVPVELQVLKPLPQDEVAAGIRRAGFALHLADKTFPEQTSSILIEVEEGSTVVVAGSIYYLGTIAQALGIGVARKPGLNQ